MPTIRRKEQERQRSLDIEMWLKNKFREGCTAMKNSFEKHDVDGTGMVGDLDYIRYLYYSCILF